MKTKTMKEEDDKKEEEEEEEEEKRRRRLAPGSFIISSSSFLSVYLIPKKKEIKNEIKTHNKKMCFFLNGTYRVFFYRVSLLINFFFDLLGNIFIDLFWYFRFIVVDCLKNVQVNVITEFNRVRSSVTGFLPSFTGFY